MVAIKIYDLSRVHADADIYVKAGHVDHSRSADPGGRCASRGCGAMRTVEEIAEKWRSLPTFCSSFILASLCNSKKRQKAQVQSISIRSDSSPT